jgi:hypothetical protein
MAAPRVARRGEAWWACLDLNQEPDRYERSTLPRNPSKISLSHWELSGFVRVRSQGFCRVSGGVDSPARQPAPCRGELRPVAKSRDRPRLEVSGPS